MAEDAVNATIKSGKLNPTNRSLTSNLGLVGGDGWVPTFFTVLAQEYVRMKVAHSGKIVPGIMDTAVAKHLSHSYGTMAERVAVIAQVFFLSKVHVLHQSLSCCQLHNSKMFVLHTSHGQGLKKRKRASRRFFSWYVRRKPRKNS